MKTQKLKSLKLVKASIANLDKQTQKEVVGGRTRAWTDCNSINYSMCATSCHAH
ncbi:class I lanthipeptide [Kordia algicida OT-1]|uniref:Uncharacterized protein n=1 Tax=Kordia algicida OT-1 TaxID=391587 RepID=A9DKH2_9FLAO|nr:class I lanthipeptide [Kordia algicida]EDP98325.1 hypothetical protein KAOT1_13947 [Kordia algicida OT-1]